MPLIESVLAIWGTAIGTASAFRDLSDFLRDRVQLEKVFTELVGRTFVQHLPRLRHLCLNEEPAFDAERFQALISSGDLTIASLEDLRRELLPLLRECISAPTAIHGESEFEPVYISVLNSAIRGLWKTIATSEALTHEVLLGQNEAILQEHRSDAVGLNRGVAGISEQITSVAGTITGLQAELKSLSEFSRSVWQQVYDKLLDSAPPAVHTIDQKTYQNPFLLARAEDFNHNYDKLARLFQSSPEWDAIQSRTENVFIEGGRGTGKSMILRRLTAQATIAAKRLRHCDSTFDSLSEDYFGVYVKLTRGYYEQFQAAEHIGTNTASLLAQHELNIEIFDAFIDTLRWLVTRQALPSSADQLDAVVRDFGALFDRAPVAQHLDDLQHTLLRFEQNQILTYYRMKAFGEPVQYLGSARPTVSFIRLLSQIFHARLFPKREVRLFLLIDEFESLLREQQVALNTVMKMRLPDISLKIGVRKAGRKTVDTFTAGDPIQTPRDYTVVPLDYGIASPHYANLLAGIASKRLSHAGYPNEDIRAYLVSATTPEVSSQDLEAQLQAMWDTGSRQEQEMNAEFVRKYTVAAVYRVLARRGKRKSHCGFDHYVTLSSGVVSNFIELCKYAFYFALSDQLPLYEQPAIPTFLQTDAAYGVSQRLLESIDGNVPVVGSTLALMLADLGQILRARLLTHPSEPEANRLAVVDYGTLATEDNKFLALVIDSAVVWSVCHMETIGDAFLPKSATRPPNAELIINRIYCPALGISPRARWRVRVSVADLRRLASPESRPAAYRKLLRAIGTYREDQPKLFAEEDAERV